MEFLWHAFKRRWLSSTFATGSTWGDLSRLDESMGPARSFRVIVLILTEVEMTHMFTIARVESPGFLARCIERIQEKTGSRVTPQDYAISFSVRRRVHNRIAAKIIMQFIAKGTSRRAAMSSPHCISISASELSNASPD
jgi:hypothetical protein